MKKNVFLELCHKRYAIHRTVVTAWEGYSNTGCGHYSLHAAGTWLKRKLFSSLGNIVGEFSLRPGSSREVWDCWQRLDSPIWNRWSM